MKVGLRVLSAGSQEGKILAITLSQFLIGRDKQCQLRPASPSISKRHCAVLIRDDKVFVRDFDSTNGTFVNDEPVKGEVELSHKDQLRAGPLAFEVLIVGAPADAKKTPTEEIKKAAAQKSAVGKVDADPKEEAEGIQKEAPAATKTEEKPEPETADVGASEGDGDDDDIAAMLLSMQDDDESGSLMDSSDEVPEGSTVMDMVVPPMPGEEGKKEGEEEEGEKSKLQKEKESQANTSTAAKAILEKYMRRPR